MASDAFMIRYSPQRKDGSPIDSRTMDKRMEGVRAGRKAHERQPAVLLPTPGRGVCIQETFRVHGGRGYVLESLAGELDQADWYEIYYHECRNDEHRKCEPWKLERSNKSSG